MGHFNDKCAICGDEFEEGDEKIFTLRLGNVHPDCFRSHRNEIEGLEDD